MNYGGYYTDSEGKLYKLVATAYGEHGPQAIYAEVNITVGDIIYCSVDDFKAQFKPTSRFA